MDEKNYHHKKNENIINIKPKFELNIKLFLLNLYSIFKIAINST